MKFHWFNLRNKYASRWKHVAYENGWDRDRDCKCLLLIDGENFGTGIASRVKGARKEALYNIICEPDKKDSSIKLSGPKSKSHTASKIETISFNDIYWLRSTDMSNLRKRIWRTLGDYMWHLTKKGIILNIQNWKIIDEVKKSKKENTNLSKHQPLFPVAEKTSIDVSLASAWSRIRKKKNSSDIRLYSNPIIEPLSRQSLEGQVHSRLPERKQIGKSGKVSNNRVPSSNKKGTPEAFKVKINSKCPQKNFPIRDEMADCKKTKGLQKFIYIKTQYTVTTEVQMEKFQYDIAENIDGKKLKSMSSDKGKYEIPQNIPLIKRNIRQTKEKGFTRRMCGILSESGAVTRDSQIRGNEGERSGGQKTNSSKKKKRKTKRINRPE